MIKKTHTPSEGMDFFKNYNSNIVLLFKNPVESGESSRTPLKLPIIRLFLTDIVTGPKVCKPVLLLMSLEFSILKSILLSGENE